MSMSSQEAYLRWIYRHTLIPSNNFNGAQPSDTLPVLQSRIYIFDPFVTTILRIIKICWLELQRLDSRYQNTLEVADKHIF